MCMYVYILADVTNPDFRSRAKLAIFPVRTEPDENEYLLVYLFILFINSKRRFPNKIIVTQFIITGVTRMY